MFKDATRFFSSVKVLLEYTHHLYIIGAVALAITAMFTDIGKDSGPMGIVYLVVISIYMLIILLLLLATTILRGKKSKYAEAIQSQHKALHLLRNSYRYLDCCILTDHHKQFSKEFFTTSLEGALTAANSAFELATGVKCRTSIKLIGAIEGTDGSSLDHMYVSTLARDSVSKTDREKEDKEEGTRHILSKNSDFAMLAQMEKSYFINGDLPKLSLYKNTSKEFVDEKQSHSYKSTIVFPIRYVLTKDDLEMEPDGSGVLGDQRLYGFFTVDCHPRNAFSETYDIQLGGGIADSLFPVLDMYRKVRQHQTALAD